MVCGPVQVVWHKFARYWDVEMREIPMSPGKYCMDAEQMLERVDENTILVVPTFGVTYTGAYEPVAELAKALDKLQEEKGLDIDIHVDGASGAFLAPFCAPEVQFDFRIPRVKSISTSGHKFGLAPLGVGWVVWRDKAELPEELIFHVTYLGGDMPDFQINFSRPAGQIIAQYYDFIRLGKEGYAADPPGLLRHRRLPGRGDRSSSARSSCCNERTPSTGIPAVTWRIKEGEDPGLHPLRPRRPAPGPRMAGAGLPADRIGVRRDGPADPGPPGGRPRPGLDPARRLRRLGGPLRQAPGVGGHDSEEAGGFNHL